VCNKKHCKSHNLPLKKFLCSFNAIFQDSWVSQYQNVSILDFTGAKNEGGGDNCSYKMCKAPVKLSPPTNQHPTFFTGWMPFLSPQPTASQLINRKYILSVK